MSVLPVEKVSQGLELAGPEALVVRNPVVDFAERPGTEAVIAFAAVAADGDKSSATEDAQVLRNGGAGHGKGPGNLTDGEFAAAKKVEDAAARGVADGGEDIEAGMVHGQLRIIGKRFLTCQEKSLPGALPAKNRGRIVARRRGGTMAEREQAQSVLITGGTDGLGKAAALLLAERGYRVFAAGRSAAKRAELDVLARERRMRLETLEMDVCDDASVKSGVQAVLEKAGALDVLVNNAGVGYVAAVEDFRLEDFRKQFETNVFGVLRVTQAVLPHMRERRRGRILMMSSVAGRIAPPTFGAYSGSKHALEGLSDALRLETYPFGIEVVLIEPGYIMTSFQQTATELAQPYVEKVKTGPYAKVYAGAWEGAKRGRARSKTTPEDCARVILRAIEEPRPRVRYGVTRLATAVAWGKRLLPDRTMDAILRRMYGVTREG